MHKCPYVYKRMISFFLSFIMILGSLSSEAFASSAINNYSAEISETSEANADGSETNADSTLEEGQEGESTTPNVSSSTVLESDRLKNLLNSDDYIASVEKMYAEQISNGDVQGLVLNLTDNKILDVIYYDPLAATFGFTSDASDIYITDGSLNDDDEVEYAVLYFGHGNGTGIDSDGNDYNIAEANLCMNVSRKFKYNGKTQTLSSTGTVSGQWSSEENKPTDWDSHLSKAAKAYNRANNSFHSGVANKTGGVTFTESDATEDFADMYVLGNPSFYDRMSDGVDFGYGYRYNWYVSSDALVYSQVDAATDSTDTINARAGIPISLNIYNNCTNPNESPEEVTTTDTEDDSDTTPIKVETVYSKAQADATVKAEVESAVADNNNTSVKDSTNDLAELNKSISKTEPSAIPARIAYLSSVLATSSSPKAKARIANTLSILNSLSSDGYIGKYDELMGYGYGDREVNAYLSDTGSAISLREHVFMDQSRDDDDSFSFSVTAEVSGPGGLYKNDYQQGGGYGYASASADASGSVPYTDIWTQTNISAVQNTDKTITITVPNQDLTDFKTGYAGIIGDTGLKCTIVYKSSTGSILKTDTRYAYSDAFVVPLNSMPSGQSGMTAEITISAAINGHHYLSDTGDDDWQEYDVNFQIGKTTLGNVSTVTSQPATITLSSTTASGTIVGSASSTNISLSSLVSATGCTPTYSILSRPSGDSSSSISSSGVLTAYTAGTYKITVSGTPLSGYTAPTSKQITVTVVRKATITASKTSISSTMPCDFEFGYSVDPLDISKYITAFGCTAKYTLITKPSDGTYSYMSGSSLYAKVPGTYKVTVSGTANSGYTAPDSIVLTITVKGMTLIPVETRVRTVTIEAGTSSVTTELSTMLGNDYKYFNVSSVSYKMSTSTSGASVDASTGRFTATAAGTYNVTVSGSASNSALYNTPSPVTLTVIVNKQATLTASQTSFSGTIGYSSSYTSINFGSYVTASNCSKTYNLTTRPSGDTSSYVSSSGYLYAYKPGTYKVTVSGTANSGYEDPNNVVLTITVKKNTYIPTTSTSKTIYLPSGGTAKAELSTMLGSYSSYNVSSVSYKLNPTSSYASVTSTGSFSATRAGTYKVTVSGSVSNSTLYNTPSAVTLTITVGDYAFITVTDANIDIGTSSLPYSVTLSNYATGTNCTLSYSLASYPSGGSSSTITSGVLKAYAPGKYKITVSGTPKSGFGTPDSATLYVTLTKDATLKATNTAGSVTIGANASSTTFNIKTSSGLSSSNCTPSYKITSSPSGGTAPSITADGVMTVYTPGVHKVTITGSPQSGYSEPSSITYTLTVYKQATLTSSYSDYYASPGSQNTIDVASKFNVVGKNCTPKYTLTSKSSGSSATINSSTGVISGVARGERYTVTVAGTTSAYYVAPNNITIDMQVRKAAWIKVKQNPVYLTMGYNDASITVNVAPYYDISGYYWYGTNVYHERSGNRGDFIEEVDSNTITFSSEGTYILVPQTESEPEYEMVESDPELTVIITRAQPPAATLKTTTSFVSVTTGNSGKTINLSDYVQYSGCTPKYRLIQAYQLSNINSASAEGAPKTADIFDENNCNGETVYNTDSEIRKDNVFYNELSVWTKNISYDSKSPLLEPGGAEVMEFEIIGEPDGSHSAPAPVRLTIKNQSGLTYVASDAGPSITGSAPAQSETTTINVNMPGTSASVDLSLYVASLYSYTTRSELKVKSISYAPSSVNSNVTISGSTATFKAPGTYTINYTMNPTNTDYCPGKGILVVKVTSTAPTLSYKSTSATVALTTTGYSSIGVNTTNFNLVKELGVTPSVSGGTYTLTDLSVVTSNNDEVSTTPSFYLSSMDTSGNMTLKQGAYYSNTYIKGTLTYKSLNGTTVSLSVKIYPRRAPKPSTIYFGYGNALPIYKTFDATKYIEVGTYMTDLNFKTTVVHDTLYNLHQKGYITDITMTKGTAGSGEANWSLSGTTITLNSYSDTNRRITLRISYRVCPQYAYGFYRQPNSSDTVIESNEYYYVSTPSIKAYYDNIIQDGTSVAELKTAISSLISDEDVRYTDLYETEDMTGAKVSDISDAFIITSISEISEQDEDGYRYVLSPVWKHVSFSSDSDLISFEGANHYEEFSTIKDNSDFIYGVDPDDTSYVDNLMYAFEDGYYECAPSASIVLYCKLDTSGCTHLSSVVKESMNGKYIPVPVRNWEKRDIDSLYYGTGKDTLPAWIFYGQNPSVLADMESSTYPFHYESSDYINSETTGTLTYNGKADYKLFTNYSSMDARNFDKMEAIASDDYNLQQQLKAYNTSISLAGMPVKATSDVTRATGSMSSSANVLYKNLIGSGTSDWETSVNPNMRIFVFKSPTKADFTGITNSYAGQSVSDLTVNSTVGYATWDTSKSYPIEGSITIDNIQNDTTGTKYFKDTKTPIPAGKYTVTYTFTPNQNKYYDSYTGTTEKGALSLMGQPLTVQLNSKPYISKSSYKPGYAEVTYVVGDEVKCDAEIDMSNTVYTLLSGTTVSDAFLVKSYSTTSTDFVKQDPTHKDKFTALKAGKATITVDITSDNDSYQNLKANFEFTIKPDKISQANLTSEASGEDDVKLTLNVVSDAGSAPTSFKWYRNGTLVATTGTNTFTVTSQYGTGTYAVSCYNAGGWSTVDGPTTTFGTIAITQPDMRDVTSNLTIPFGTTLQNAVQHTSTGGTMRCMTSYNGVDNSAYFKINLNSSAGAIYRYNIECLKPTPSTGGVAESRAVWIKECATATSLSNIAPVYIAASKGTVDLYNFIGANVNAGEKSYDTTYAASTSALLITSMTAIGNVGLPTSYTVKYTKGEDSINNTSYTFGQYTINSNDWVYSNIDNLYHYNSTTVLSSTEHPLDAGTYYFWFETAESDYYKPSTTKSGNYCILNVNPSQIYVNLKDLDTINLSIGDPHRIDLKDYLEATDAYTGAKIDGTYEFDETKCSAAWGGSEYVSSTQNASSRIFFKFYPADKYNGNYAVYESYLTPTCSAATIEGSATPATYIETDSSDEKAVVKNSDGNYYLTVGDTLKLKVSYKPTTAYFDQVSGRPTSLEATVRVGTKRDQINITWDASAKAYVGTATITGLTASSEGNEIRCSISRTNYTTAVNDTFSGLVYVSKYRPVVVTNPTASDIDWGNYINTSILSGGSVTHGDETVSGSWRFASDDTTIYDAGTHYLTATFTPSDTATYAAISVDNIPLKVKPITPTISTSMNEYQRGTYDPFDLGVKTKSDGTLTATGYDSSLIDVKVNGKQVIVTPKKKNVLGTTTIDLKTSATKNCAASEVKTVRVTFNVVDWNSVGWDYSESRRSDSYEFKCTENKSNFTSSVRLTNIPSAYHVDYVFTKSDNNTTSGTFYQATNNEVNGMGVYAVKATITTSDATSNPLGNKTVWDEYITVLSSGPPAAYEGKVNWDSIGFSKDTYNYKSTIPAEVVDHPYLSNLPVDFESYYKVTYTITDTSNGGSRVVDTIYTEDGKTYTITATVTSIDPTCAPNPDKGKGVYTCKIVVDEKGTPPTTVTEGTTETTTEEHEDNTANEDWSLVGFAGNPIVYTYDGTAKTAKLYNLNSHYTAQYEYKDSSSGKAVAEMKNVGTYDVTAKIINTSNATTHPMPESKYLTYTTKVIINKKDWNWDWSSVCFGSHDSLGYDYRYTGTPVNYTLRNMPSSGYTVEYVMTDSYGTTTKSYDGAYVNGEGTYKVDATIITDSNHTEPPTEYRKHSTIIRVYTTEPDAEPDPDWKDVRFASDSFTFYYDGSSKIVKLVSEPDSSNYKTTYEYYTVAGSNETKLTSSAYPVEVGNYKVYAYITSTDRGSHSVPQGYSILSAEIHILEQETTTEPSTETTSEGEEGSEETTESAAANPWTKVSWVNDKVKLDKDSSSLKSDIEAIQLTNLPEGFDGKVTYTYYNGNEAKTVDDLAGGTYLGAIIVNATVTGAPAKYANYSTYFTIIDKSKPITDEWNKLKWVPASGTTYEYSSGVYHNAVLTGIPSGYEAAYTYAFRESVDSVLKDANGNNVTSVSEVGNYVVTATITNSDSHDFEGVPSEVTHSVMYMSIVKSEKDSEYEDVPSDKEDTNNMFKGCRFNYSTYYFEYDGYTDWFNKIKFDDKLPDGYTVKYTDDNGDDVTSIVNVGTYNITATISAKSGYGEVPDDCKYSTTKVIVYDGKLPTEPDFTKVKFNKTNMVNPEGTVPQIYLENVPEKYTVTYAYYDITKGLDGKAEVDLSTLVKVGTYQVIATINAGEGCTEVPEAFRQYSTTVTTVAEVITPVQDPDWDDVRFTKDYYEFNYKEGSTYKPTLINVPNGFSYTLTYTVYDSETKSYDEHEGDIEDVGLYRATANVFSLGSGKVPDSFAAPTCVIKVIDPLKPEPEIVPSYEEWAKVRFEKDAFTYTYDGGAKEPKLLNVPDGYTNKVIYTNYNSEKQPVDSIYEAGTYTRHATISGAPEGFTDYECTITIQPIAEPLEDWGKITWDYSDSLDSNSYVFAYDSQTRQESKVRLKNVPDGYTVEYKYNQGGTDRNYIFEAGTYTVTATIIDAPEVYSTYFTKVIVVNDEEDYNNLSDTWKKVGFSSSSYRYAYDGQPHNIQLIGVPYYCDVTYIYTDVNTNKTVENIIEIGKYKVEAKLTLSDGVDSESFTIPDGYDYYVASVVIYDPDEEITTKDPSTESTTDPSTESTSVDPSAETTTTDSSDEPETQAKTIWSNVRFEKDVYRIGIGENFSEAKLKGLPYGYYALSYEYAAVGSSAYTPISSEGSMTAGTYILRATVDRVSAAYADVPDNYKYIYATGIVSSVAEEDIPIIWRDMHWSQSRYEYTYDKDNPIDHANEIVLVNIPDGYSASYSYAVRNADGSFSDTDTIMNVGSYQITAKLSGSGTIPDGYSTLMTYAVINEASTSSGDDKEEDKDKDDDVTGITDDWSKVKFGKSQYKYPVSYDDDGEAIEIATPQLKYIVEGYHAEYLLYKAESGNFIPADNISDIGTYQVYAYVYKDETNERPEEYKPQMTTVVVYDPGEVVDDKWANVRWSSDDYTLEYTGQAQNPVLVNVPAGYIVNYNYTQLANGEYKPVDNIIEIGNYSATAYIMKDDSYSLYLDDVPASKEFWSTTVTIVDATEGGGDGDDDEEKDDSEHSFKFGKSLYQFAYDRDVDYYNTVADDIQGLNKDEHTYDISLDIYDISAKGPYHYLKEIGIYTVTADIIVDGDASAIYHCSTRVEIYDPTTGPSTVDESIWGKVGFSKSYYERYYTGASIAFPELKNVPDGYSVTYIAYYNNSTNYQTEMMAIGTYKVDAVITANDGSDPVPTMYQHNYCTVVVIERPKNPDDPGSDESTESTTETTSKSYVDDPTEETTETVELPDDLQGVKWNNDSDRKYTGGTLSSPYLTGYPSTYNVSYAMYLTSDTSNPVVFRDPGTYVCIATLIKVEGEDITSIELRSRNIAVTKKTDIPGSGDEDEDDDDGLMPTDKKLLTYMKFAKSRFTYKHTGEPVEVPQVVCIPTDENGVPGYTVDYTLTSIDTGEIVDEMVDLGAYKVEGHLTAQPGWSTPPNNPLVCLVYIVDYDPDPDDGGYGETDPYEPPPGYDLLPKNPESLANIAFASDVYYRTYTGDPVDLPKVYYVPSRGYTVEYQAFDITHDEAPIEADEITDIGEYYIVATIKNDVGYYEVENYNSHYPLAATLYVIAPPTDPDPDDPDDPDKSTETTTETPPSQVVTEEPTETTSERDPMDADGNDWSKVGFDKSSYTYLYTGSEITHPTIQNLPNEGKGYSVTYTLTGKSDVLKDVGKYTLTATVKSTGDVADPPDGYDTYTCKIAVVLQTPDVPDKPETTETTTESTTESTTEAATESTTDKDGDGDGDGEKDDTTESTTDEWAVWDGIGFASDKYVYIYSDEEQPMPLVQGIPDTGDYSVEYELYYGEEPGDVIKDIGTYTLHATVTYELNSATLQLECTIEVLDSGSSSVDEWWNDVKFEKDEFNYAYKNGEVIPHPTLKNVRDGYSTSYEIALNGESVESITKIGDYTVYGMVDLGSGQLLVRSCIVHVRDDFREDETDIPSSTESTTEAPTESTTESKSDPGDEGSTEPSTEDPLGGKIGFIKSTFTYEYTGNPIPHPTLRNVPAGKTVTYTIMRGNSEVKEIKDIARYTVKAVVDGDDTVYTCTVMVVPKAAEPSTGFDKPEEPHESTTEPSTETTSKKDPSGSGDEGSSETTTQSGGGTGGTGGDSGGEGSSETTTQGQGTGGDSGGGESSETTTQGQGTGGGSGSEGSTEPSTEDPLGGRIGFAKSMFTYEYTGNPIPHPTLRNVPANKTVTYTITRGSSEVAVIREIAKYVVKAVVEGDSTVYSCTVAVVNKSAEPSTGFDKPEPPHESTTEPSTETTSKRDPSNPGDEGSSESTTEGKGDSGHEGSTEPSTEDPLGGKIGFVKSMFTYEYTGSPIPHPTLRNVPDGKSVTYTIMRGTSEVAQIKDIARYTVKAVVDGDSTVYSCTVLVVTRAARPDEGFDKPEDPHEPNTEPSTETTSEKDPDDSGDEDSSESTTETPVTPEGDEWVVDDGTLFSASDDPYDWDWSHVRFASDYLVVNRDSDAHQPYLQFLPEEGYYVFYTLRNGIQVVSNAKMIGIYQVTARIVALDGYEEVPIEYARHTCYFKITYDDLSNNKTISDLHLDLTEEEIEQILLEKKEIIIPGLEVTEPDVEVETETSGLVESVENQESSSDDAEFTEDSVEDEMTEPDKPTTDDTNTSEETPEETPDKTEDTDPDTDKVTDVTENKTEPSDSSTEEAGQDVNEPAGDNPADSPADNSSAESSDTGSVDSSDSGSSDSSDSSGDSSGGSSSDSSSDSSDSASTGE